MKNRIILITGPKHSGKTLAARALGKIMNSVAIDLDELVEKQSGRSPRELYKEGAEIFKKAEAKALSSLIKDQEVSIIIAAGGGLIDNDEAIGLLDRHREPSAPLEIITIYLDVSAETAWQRIVQTSAELPPFLNTENPKETHLALHKRRAKAYKTFARFVISAENKTPEQIAREMIALTK